MPDPVENLGARMVREVASKTSDIAGDGTTTATVLAQAIIREGSKNVAAGANPMGLKRGIEKAVERMVTDLKGLSQPVKGDMIAQVGIVSANNDETIGKIIAEAMDKVGKDGVITVEEAKTMETALEVVEGMQFDRGYLSPYFVTDPERMECVLEDPLILIHERKISAMKDQGVQGQTLGLQRANRGVRGPRQGRRHRSHQGRENGADERGFHSLAALDDRGARLGNPREGEARACGARPRDGRLLITRDEWRIGLGRPNATQLRS